MMHSDLNGILIDEKQLDTRISELADEISNDYEGKSIVMVGILSGAVIFYSELVRKINLEAAFDFMAVSSYGHASQTSGIVKIVKDLNFNIEDKHVIIVEDIIDSGLTLKFLVENLRVRKPASIKTCCLLDKPSRRKTDMKADYVGFCVPDEFLVGFGLDYAQKYRNLPYVGILKPEIYTK